MDVLTKKLRWSDERAREIAELRERFPIPQAMQLPLLWMQQQDHGWVSPEAMELVAETCETTPAWVYSLATFYTMFELERPVKYHVQVCRTLACALVGSDSITGHIEKKLGIRCGEVSDDGRFRLSEVECLASCGSGPMMQVNDAYYENLTPEKVDGLLARWMKE